ncbi:hypothetical protein [Actinomadura parmotrematis]|uniref:Secreted protein n=1 Tax=Actinomadura parmotrematis TaxID=2864039 RepID=A0ABS7FYT3_9ACTN|nr:hypothetical protein [Actinomadura parmotrematis]MBW8484737.1 hypothetical protein [Actinomadura parmotrematis]
MFKRLVAATLIGGAGFMAFAATPAMADEDPSNVQIVGVQTCRGIDVAGVGAAIHNILGISHEEGDCINGSSFNH